MKRIFTFFLLLFSPIIFFAQENEWEWWNTLHGWQDGMKGWRMWLIISPGYLGPNALPVPEVKKGFLLSETEFEFGAESHFKKGDPTQDIFSRLYVPFAHQKIAVEVYGVIAEHYAMSTRIRDERFARDRNGKGWTQGDFYFTTLVQLLKNRNFPNTLLRMAARTSSGGMYEAGRYSDSPGYFFDLSFSKPAGFLKSGTLTPFASIGFYNWQTNDELNLQNDAFMYGAGLDLKKDFWNTSLCLSGYSGYKNQRDDPMVLTFDLRRDVGNRAIRFQIINGLKSWDYTTVRFSAVWYFKGIN